jgi:hypothetical protein
MNKRQKRKIVAVCLTVSAVCTFGAGMLQVTAGQTGLGAFSLLGAGFCAWGAFLNWRDFYILREDE